MGVIASAELDLNIVNDAYSVSLTNPVCAVHADFDGTNPKLDNAITIISVNRGGVIVPFVTSITQQSPVEIVVSCQKASPNGTQWQARFTGIPFNVLEGFVVIHVETEDGWNTDLTWRYTVVRESSMLDWIKDWESNKTKVGNDYVITPKLFVGKKLTQITEDGIVEDALTGVYIGPDGQFGESAGVYGYKEGNEIFHLNETGGMIGGWMIENGGIQTAKGNLKVLSSGKIQVTNEQGDDIWALNEDGSAQFCGGNVKFFANGDAEFKGQIVSSSGSIAGWAITKGAITSNGIGLDNTNHAIAVLAGNIVYDQVFNLATGAATNVANYKRSVEENGGVMMYYTHGNDYGVASYIKRPLGAAKIFSLGSDNYIAGWHFDDDAIYLGEKVNGVNQNTASPDHITLGTNGLRGSTWRIDTTGDASFGNGVAQFTSNGGTVAGWTLGEKQLASHYVAIVSDSGKSGLYMSANKGAAFYNQSPNGMLSFIRGSGGIFLTAGANSVELAAYTNSGKLAFDLSSNSVNHIAGWSFDADTLYTGNAPVINAADYAADGCITISPLGIFGSKWRLLKDGSGDLAEGKIHWTAGGEITFDAKVSADNITAGTISTADIQNANGTWFLKQDGSGQLANGSIFWNKNGTLDVKGIFRPSLYYGSTKVLDNTLSRYQIDPAVEPYNWFMFDNPGKRYVILLPQAALYEGLEISFFIRGYDTWTSDTATHIWAYGNSEESFEYIRARSNVHNIYIEGTGMNMKFATVEDHNTRYKNTRGVMTLPDSMYRFKSMGGMWYMVEGLWTGEV